MTATPPAAPPGHVVFIAHGMTSPLNASLELCRRLAAAGHRVTFVSHADIAAEVAANGFGFVPLTSDEEIRAPQHEPGTRNPVTRLRQMLQARQNSIQSDEIERVIVGLDPDVLLIDIELHYAIIATARLNIPTLLAMNWFSVFRSADLPPLNTRLRPDSGRRQVAQAWRRVRWQAWMARLKHKMGKGGIGDLVRPVAYSSIHYADLRQVARARGYSLEDNTARTHWLRPYMYTRLPVMCFNAYELEFPHTPHPNLHYVGPMVNRRRPEGRIDAESMKRWEAYMQARGEAGSTRPLVYCSLGSYWSDPAFLRMVIETFARRPEWDLVLGLGGQVKEADLGPIPDNTLVLDWAPQLEVLEQADCAINHGGITSINECLAYEVPMVVYSPSLLDQDGCAARIEYHGLGVSAEWDHQDHAGLERHISHVLTDGDIGENVRAMRRAFDRYVEERVAVDLIERHMRRAPANRE